MIITGESSSGKTTTVRKILEKWEGSAFVFVTGEKFNEYPDHRRLDSGDFLALKWDRGVQRVRFIPKSNVQISQAEAATVFSHLNFIRHSENPNNEIIVEEGHRFSQDANLRALLVEGRKFCRKVIPVRADRRAYEGIAKVFKPPAWECMKAPELD